MPSDAGRALSHRRREFSFVHLAPFHSRSIFSPLLLNFCFPFLNPFQTLLNLWLLVRSSTTKIQERRWCPAISISRPQLVSPLPFLPSFPGTAMFLWFSSFLSNLDQNHHLPTLGSPKMIAPPQNLSSSPYGGHHAHVRLLPAFVKLGLQQLVGFIIFGPLWSPQPKPSRCFQTHYLLKPRSVPFLFLFISSQSLCLLSKLFVQGLQIERYASLLLWLSKIIVRILPLDSPRVIGHEIHCLIIEVFRLKKIGIMIPSPWSGDYRCFFNPSSRFPLNTETKQVLITNLMAIIHETRSLRKNGIMIPSLRSGDYRSFLNFLSPYAPLTEPIHVQTINCRDNFLTPKSLKLASGYIFHVSNRRQTLCEILNLHGHVREDPPVLLRFLCSLVRILALASFCFVLSKLNYQSTTTLASNLKHQITTTFARTRAKALRVLLLMPVRFTTLASSSTPLGLLTVAICSSIDSFLEELSITFDLTCTKKLLSFWLKALKELLLFNLIYPFFYLMLALGNALYGCIVTRDGCPVVFHDIFMFTQEQGVIIEKRVTEMALHEFLSYGPQKDGTNVKPMLRKTKDGRIFEWKVEKDAPLCTLEEAFVKVKHSLGFNIELKFDDNIGYGEEELRQTLDNILKVVNEHSKNRPIIFSSFHPDAVRLIRNMQRSYPVFFLTNGGCEIYKDVRRNSLDEAIKLCKESGLQGIVSEVKAILRTPNAITRVKDSKLSLLSYGQLNNVVEVIYLQYLMGVEGVIVDMVKDISEAIANIEVTKEDDDGRKCLIRFGEERKKVEISKDEITLLTKFVPKLLQQ